MEARDLERIEQLAEFVYKNPTLSRYELMVLFRTAVAIGQGMQVEAKHTPSAAHVTEDVWEVKKKRLWRSMIKNSYNMRKVAAHLNMSYKAVLDWRKRFGYPPEGWRG